MAKPMYVFLTFLSLMFCVSGFAGTIMTRNGLMYSHASYNAQRIGIYETTQRFLRSIDLGTEIITFAFHGDYLYGISQTDRAIVVLNLITERVENKIPVGENPSHICFINGHAYVTNERSRDVSVIETKDLKLVATIPLGTVPAHLAATGTHLFITGLTFDVLVVVDGQSHQILSRIPFPHGQQTSHITDIIIHDGCAWLCVENVHDQGIQLIRVNLETLSFEKPITIVPPDAVRSSSTKLIQVVQDERSYFGLGEMHSLPIVVLLFQKLAYVFYGEGMSVLMIHDLKTGSRLVTLPLPISNGSIQFSTTHLMYDGRPFFPLLPTKRLLKELTSKNAMHLYRDCCPAAFLFNPAEAKQGICAQSDRDFFLNLSGVASHAQELIYEYLPAAYVLYALLQTTENKYLNSIEWMNVKKRDLLIVLCRYCWFQKTEQAQMICAMLHQLDPHILSVFNPPVCH